VAALLVAGALAWAYSAPPLRLLARGLGEVDTALVVTGLVPFAAFALQARAGDAVATLLAAVAPLAILQFAMLLAIEFPDAAGDAATGKRTLVVRLGGARAARLHAAANVAAIGALVAAAGAGLPVVPALAVAPLAAWRASRALAGDGGDPRRHESTAFWAVALVALTGALELAGLVYPALGWPSPR
jgi:1,4-dihydroxy-2-naphthoate octaprenyltransferase